MGLFQSGWPESAISACAVTHTGVWGLPLEQFARIDIGIAVAAGVPAIEAQTSQTQCCGSAPTRGATSRAKPFESTLVLASAEANASTMLPDCR